MLYLNWWPPLMHTITAILYAISGIPILYCFYIMFYVHCCCHNFQIVVLFLILVLLVKLHFYSFSRYFCRNILLVVDTMSKIYTLYFHLTTLLDIIDRLNFLVLFLFIYLTVVRFRTTAHQCII